MTRAPAIGAGLVALGVSTAIARSRTVHGTEHDVFRSVNDLPGALLVPAFALMQAGSYASVFVTSGVLAVADRRRTAAAATLAGTAAWVGCKVVKKAVGRGRPPAHLRGVTTRGPAESGLGFPSGHSAVAFTLASLVSAELPTGMRPLVWTWAGIVAGSRVYVGAHLPLDIVGGAGLGLAIGTTTRAVLDAVAGEDGAGGEGAGDRAGVDPGGPGPQLVASAAR